MNFQKIQKQKKKKDKNLDINSNTCAICLENSSSQQTIQLS